MTPRRRSPRGELKGDTGGGCGNNWAAISCSKDAANAPWGWDDADDGPVFRGEMALDPAHLVHQYFGGLGDFSHQYLRNRYLIDLQSRGYGPGRLPRGWPSQVDLGVLFGKLTTSCP